MLHFVLETHLFMLSLNKSFLLFLTNVLSKILNIYQNVLYLHYIYNILYLFNPKLINFFLDVFNTLFLTPKNLFIENLIGL